MSSRTIVCMQMEQMQAKMVDMRSSHLLNASFAVTPTLRARPLNGMLLGGKARHVTFSKTRLHKDRVDHSGVMQSAT